MKQHWLLCLLLIAGCTKIENVPSQPSTQNDQHAEHSTKISKWFQFLPVEGKFTSPAKAKTINFEGSTITRITYGTGNHSLLFISRNGKFHMYGINADQLKVEKNASSGIVNIYDFQTLNIKGVRYPNGQFKGFIKYENNEPIVDTYNGIYNFSINSGTSRNVPAHIISALRRFFCELFGHVWYADVASNGGTKWFVRLTGNYRLRRRRDQHYTTRRPGRRILANDKQSMVLHR